MTLEHSQMFRLKTILRDRVIDTTEQCFIPAISRASLRDWQARTEKYVRLRWRYAASFGPSDGTFTEQDAEDITFQWLPLSRHLHITRYLRSLPERQIPNLVQVFIAATMAADALDGLNEDWVTETTREMRVAVMYGILPLANASNDEIVEAIRQLEALHEDE